MRSGRPFVAAWRFVHRPQVMDTALVAVLVIGSVWAIIVATSMNAGLPSTLNIAHMLVAALPLLVRRSRPLLTAATLTALDTLAIVAELSTAANIPTLIAYYSVGRYTGGRTTAIAAAAGATVYGTLFWIYEPGQGSMVAGALMPLVPIGVGQFFRLRAELRDRAKREAADSAVRAERRRIARELHDVVAHHLSVINALVGGARATLDPGQDVTRDALTSAEQTARQALSEMRHLLDVLRADDGGAADAATGVGADRLPMLVEEARTGGLPASLTVTGTVVPLPAGVDHAVYRIVQESLTNTRKHAHGARASITLAYEREAVEVEVVDDGIAGPPGVPGFGLGGMAERVALCGGRLETGPRPEGGFRVHARLPL